MPYISHKPFYITIVDPEGGIFMGDNSFVPVTHRVYCDGQAFYGFESLRKFFPVHGDLVRFLAQATEQPTGTHGRLTWEHK